MVPFNGGLVGVLVVFAIVVITLLILHAAGVNL
jgi:hypothetical protein